MQEITQKMINEIENKEQLINDLHTKLDKITNLELEEATERTTLLNSKDWDKKLDGAKVTEKAKTAYCDKQLEKKVTEIKWLKNDIQKIKNLIDLSNNKISCYKYMIREMEL